VLTLCAEKGREREREEERERKRKKKEKPILSLHFMSWPSRHAQVEIKKTDLLLSQKVFKREKKE